MGAPLRFRSVIPVYLRFKSTNLSELSGCDVLPILNGAGTSLKMICLNPYYAICTVPERILRYMIKSQNFLKENFLNEDVTEKKFRSTSKR